MKNHNTLSDNVATRQIFLSSKRRDVVKLQKLLAIKIIDTLRMHEYLIKTYVAAVI
jgi:hypothetical protein